MRCGYSPETHLTKYLTPRRLWLRSTRGTGAGASRFPCGSIGGRSGATPHRRERADARTGPGRCVSLAGPLCAHRPGGGEDFAGEGSYPSLRDRCASGGPLDNADQTIDAHPFTANRAQPASLHSLPPPGRRMLRSLWLRIAAGRGSNKSGSTDRAKPLCLPGSAGRLPSRLRSSSEAWSEKSHTQVRPQ